ncbi:hypothetical protein Tco_1211850 [Tanacetum coccineum]
MSQHQRLREKIFDQVRVNSEILVKEVQDQLQHDLEFHVSVSKAFRAKAKAKREIRGDHVLQYYMLRDYVVELQSTNPNTIVKIAVERNTDPSLPTRVFKRIYDCLGALKVGFRASRRELLGLDGAFIKGPFPGQCLGDDIDLHPNSNFTFISDRQKGIIPTIKTVFPSVEHRFCLGYIHENMKQGWCGQAYKDLLWRSASDTSVKEFEKCMLEVTYEFRDKQCRAKSDILLNNICEVFNGKIVGGRDKPMITLLEYIREYFMNRIVNVQSVIDKCTGPLTSIATRIMESIKKEAYLMKVQWNEGNKYQVSGLFGDQCIVDVMARTCSCRKWELTVIPGLLAGIHGLFSGRNCCLVKRITCGYPWPELEGKRIWYDPRAIEVVCLVFEWLIGLTCMYYVWHGKSKEEHEVHLKLVLESLRKEKLYAKFFKSNIVGDALSRKERVKSTRVRGMILAAQSEALKQENVLLVGSVMDEAHASRYLILEDIMRACVIDFGGSYHLSVRCAPFKALYGRKCRSPVLWAEIGESSLTRLELVPETTDKVVLVKEKPKAARDHQKSDVDYRRKPLEFEVGDHVLLKVTPWKGVVRFGKKGKLAPRYVGPFEILKRIGLVAYRLRLPEELNSVHDTFHVSNQKKCLAYANLHVSLDEIKVDKTFRFVEEPVEIMDREIKRLKPRKVALVKVRWNSKHGPEFTWEHGDQMRIKYPQLFVDRVVEPAS